MTLTLMKKAESSRTERGKSNRALLLVVPLSWMALMRYLSSDQMNGDSTSMIVGPLLHWVFPAWAPWQIELGHYLVRKCAHITEYAILCCLWIRCLGIWVGNNKAVSPCSQIVHRKFEIRIIRGNVNEMRFIFYVSIFICVIYAFLDEVGQRGTQTRGGSIFDVGLDLFGILTAAYLILALQKVKSFIKSLTVRDK
jgi:VanZ family protein